MSDLDDDCKEILDDSLALAEFSLLKRGEFYPFGVTLPLEGKAHIAMAYDGREHPPSKDILSLLRSSFRKNAMAGKIKATAIAFEAILTYYDNSKEKVIVVEIDHRDNYSRIFRFKYAISGEDVEFGLIEIIDGESNIFS